MKTENLMIGDWVSITEPDDFHGYIGKVVIINDETGYITVHIPNMHMHDVLCDDLQPIDLTRDIFEKNGFRYEQGYSSEIYWIEGDEMFHAHYQDKYGYHVIWADAYGDENMYKKISYVHELQHLLRLCGIKKEIIL